ncbi:MAG: hypothetical protein HY072_08630 [Deltaproteobacteria bacterium]|nr:hypothetical protein [Deltaproteobacteria bacterium]
MKPIITLIGICGALVLFVNSSSANFQKWDACMNKGLCQIKATCNFEGFDFTIDNPSNVLNPLYDKEPIRKVFYIAQRSFRLVTLTKLDEENCLFTLQRQ